MESKAISQTGNAYEKWTNHEKQTGIQYLRGFDRDGKPSRKFRFRFRFRGRLYSEVIGWESKTLTEKKILEMWERYAANRTLGQEPFSPGGAVEMQEEAREEAIRQEAAAKANTLASLFEEAMQLRDVNTSEEHRHHYRQIYRDWIEPVIGDLPIKELKAVHIAQVLKNLQDGTIPREMPDEERKRYKTAPRSTQTQEHAWYAIRIIWTHAVDNGLVSGNYPGAKIKPKVNNERMRYLTEAEAKMVLDDLRGSGKRTAGGHGKGGQKGSIDAWGKALLSLHCGLRAGEILELTWRNVSLSDRIGIIYDTKNKGTSRKFYLTKAVVQMFQERLTLSSYTKPGDLVFPNRNGGKVAEMGDVFARCFKRIGLNKGDEPAQDKVVFHTFRHTFATWHAQHSTPMSVLAELMGHSITKTTERYIQYAPKTVIRDAIGFYAGMHEDQASIDVTPALPE